jgi:hypothetical protein
MRRVSSVTEFREILLNPTGRRNATGYAVWTNILLHATISNPHYAAQILYLDHDHDQNH